MFYRRINGIKVGKKIAPLGIDPCGTNLKVVRL
jgi:hypothetical protein